MALRVSPLFRGVPARLGAVLLLAGGVGTWIGWPMIEAPTAPASMTLAGKHGERLAFGGDESEIPVRDARIYDTIAMFAQPRIEPRPWSEAPVSATMRETGIKPVPLRPVLRAAANEVSRRPADNLPRLIQAASAERARLAAGEPEASRPVTVFGWDVPGSQHLPSRGAAVRVIDKVGSGAAAVGSGTVRVVSRSASAVGDGVATVGDKVASAGSAIARTIGLD